MDQNDILITVFRVSGRTAEERSNTDQPSENSVSGTQLFHLYIDQQAADALKGSWLADVL
jgi:hypothetical protein